MVKSTSTIPISPLWQKTYKIKGVLNPGDTIPTELVSLFENNSPHLVDSFVKVPGGKYVRVAKTEAKLVKTVKKVK